jgi:hypothetical protein
MYVTIMQGSIKDLDDVNGLLGMMKMKGLNVFKMSSRWGLDTR